MVEIDFGGEGGSHWVLCCRLLPTPPNSTPQLAFLRRLTDWFRAVAPGVLGVPKHLADVRMPERTEPLFEAGITSRARLSWLALDEDLLAQKLHRG